MATCGECGQEIFIGSWPFCGPNGHPPARGGDALGCIPPVIFQNSEGHILFPGRSDERPPAGYESVELRTSPQREKFEREFTARLRADHQNEQLREQLLSDYCSKPRIEELKRNLDKIPPHLKGYAKRAIQRYDQRSISYAAARHQPVGFFEAFQMDASSRERCDDPKPMSERQRR